MKTTSKLLKFFLFVFAVVLMGSCSDDDGNIPIEQQDSDIVDLAIATDDLSILVAALQRADLVSALQADGPFTVFAPTNAAFEAFLNANNFASLEDVPVEILTQVLLNHVVSGEFTSGSLSSGYVSSLSTAGAGGNNLSLFINTSSGVTINGISDVITADVDATNGVVHIVDAVIDIPTVVTFAVADPNFSTLVSALTELTPNTDFAGILSRTEGGNGDGIDPDFTVFAPTNAAFDALPSIPDEPVLTQVLLHHVVGGANVRSGDLTDGIMAATLEGDDITINLPGTGDNIADVTDGSGTSDIGIIAVDVQAGNGVIHVLNKVMIPDTNN
ncbi:fasciclin domain-containing protein [Muriicola sp.]|uniref:fasciclin domain-containing protein n=1 Tax=Muriicola sp. TaxID=2020856 RepID=UPI003561C506